MRVASVALAVLLGILGTRPLVARAQGELSAVILSPVPGEKIRAGRSLSVRISIKGGEGGHWAVSFAPEGLPEVVLATGTEAAVPGREVATIDGDQLSPGGRYTVSLLATNGAGGSAAANVGIISPAPMFQLIPLEPGNLTKIPLDSCSVDASGNLVLVAGEGADPQPFDLLHRDTGEHQTLLVKTGDSQGNGLSPDGMRFFFKGFFPMAGNVVQFGVGFLDLDTELTRLIVKDGSVYFTGSNDGRRIAYLGSDAERNQQYFVWDEASGDKLQITHLPHGLPENNGLGCLPAQNNSPLIAGDGSKVVMISETSLDGGSHDPAVGCKVSVFDIASGTTRQVLSLPQEDDIAFPHLSRNGRWLSFVHGVHPGGIAMQTPALLNLESGEFRSPAIDLNGQSTYEAVVTGDGAGMIISNQGDLDPTVGNADHNFELFHYDFATGTFSQITETLDGITGSINGCSPYKPRTSDDGSVAAFLFYLGSLPTCAVSGPQKAESNGLSFRFTRAVPKRLDNHGPQLAAPESIEVVAGKPLELSLSAKDPDGDPITFFAQQTGTIDVPPGSEVIDHHDGTATFRWPTRPADAGTYPLRVAAFDEGGGEDVRDITLSIVASERPSCIGDCSGNGSVEVAELIKGVDIALGLMPLTECRAIDANGDGSVSVDELIGAVSAILAGCSGGV